MQIKTTECERDHISCSIKDQNNITLCRSESLFCAHRNLALFSDLIVFSSCWCGLYLFDIERKSLKS